jgi:hypothetical protein
MPFSNHFPQCSQMGQVIEKHVLALITSGIPHHHVGRLKIVILVTKVMIFLIN